ncbi:MAG: FAD-binding oxidoreductase [Pseudomonadota bacterium]
MAAGSTYERADCLVLGAGIVGVSTALALQAAGRDVILVDRKQPGTGTSFGNAGIIQGEGVTPYMLPRNIATLTAMALNRRPEAHLHYRSVLALLPWLARYFWNSSERRFHAIASANAPLIARCVETHRKLMAEAGAEHLLSDRGYLRVVRDTEDMAAEEAVQQDAQARYGVEYEVCNPDRLAELEPHLAGNLVGGFLMPQPASISDPLALTEAYLALFRRRGGRLATADATLLARDEAGDLPGWSVETAEGALSARDAVLCLGPWSRDLLNSFGVNAPLATKRGYHMHFAAEGNAVLNRPVLDLDNGYVLAPMTKGVRLTTGAEFATRDRPATPRQLEMVTPKARQLFPLGAKRDAGPWLGARPCFPDMLPMVGPVPGRAGLWANLGHHHLGLTLGPVTGELIAAMVTGAAPFTDPQPYRVGRFGRG